MTKKNKIYLSIIITFILICILSVVIIFSHIGNNLSNFLDESTTSECGLSYGPIYGGDFTGDHTKLDLKCTIDCPGGQISFANIDNNQPIVIIKTDASGNLLWVKEFNSEELELPFLKISGIFLSKEEACIHFFNESMSEAGRLVLDEHYNFEYVCLKPL
jgi:hypothetical protein